MTKFNLSALNSLKLAENLIEEIRYEQKKQNSINIKKFQNGFWEERLYTYIKNLLKISNLIHNFLCYLNTY